MRPDLPNPFTNARVLGADTEPEYYHDFQNGPRGRREHVMSRGSLADFVACPDKWRAGYESRETNATKWGTLMDTLVLSPGQFDTRFEVYPTTYPCSPTAKDPRSEKPWNNTATFAKEWKKERAGKTFIYREKFGDDGEADEDTQTATLGNAQRAQARLLQSPAIAEIITCSKTQVMVTAEYRDRDTRIAVPFKCLLDLVPAKAHPVFGRTLADYKTARNGSEGGFKKAIHDGFYDWQASIYADCYVAATGEDRTDFLFAVQENTPPYQPSFWSIGYDWMQDARAEVRQALRLYCWCVAHDQWPGYPVSLPISAWGNLSREAYMLRNIEPPPTAPREREPLHEQEVTP